MVVVVRLRIKTADKEVTVPAIAMQGLKVTGLR